MADKTLMAYIKMMGKPVFTTKELSAVSGKSQSTVSQGLTFLRGQGLVFKIYHGIWQEGKGAPSPYSVISYLFPRQRSYVSFTSALHLYGIIEQIPQTITVASISHTKEISTNAGVFLAHQIAPSFFKGFVWYKEQGDFLIAEPEKALADCLYISGFRKKQFSHFPELRFSKKFNFDRVKYWIKKIKNPKITVHALKRLESISEHSEAEKLED
ncbi:MAG: ArsR family transcriptional regulator [Elusimicrobia bacterium]|nr:ArsR family transcriptional regulator [Elusimicrobiota bacterium]